MLGLMTLSHVVNQKWNKNNVFGENRCPPIMNFPFFYCCDLEN